LAVILKAARLAIIKVTWYHKISREKQKNKMNLAGIKFVRN
jgi:hypothetical protein